MWEKVRHGSERLPIRNSFISFYHHVRKSQTSRIHGYQHRRDPSWPSQDGTFQRCCTKVCLEPITLRMNSQCHPSGRPKTFDSFAQENSGRFRDFWPIQGHLYPLESTLVLKGTKTRSSTGNQYWHVFQEPSNSFVYDTECEFETALIPVHID